MMKPESLPASVRPEQESLASYVYGRVYFNNRSRFVATKTRPELVEGSPA
jgi:hypothetical protein